MKLRDKYMRIKLYKAQKGRCKAPCGPDFCGVHLELRLLELDHIDSDGPDGIENRQLLCSHCNRVKRDQPMEYLMNYHLMRWEMDQMRRNQLTLTPQERIAKRRQPVVNGKQKLQPQYMDVACMAGVLFAASRHLSI